MPPSLPLPKRKHRATSPPAAPNVRAEQLAESERRRADAEQRAKHAEAALGVEAHECALKLQSKQNDIVSIQRSAKKQSQKVIKLEGQVDQLKTELLEQQAALADAKAQQLAAEGVARKTATENRRLHERLTTFDEQLRASAAAKAEVTRLKGLLASEAARADQAVEDAASAIAQIAELEKSVNDTDVHKSRSVHELQKKSEGRTQLALDCGLEPGKFSVPSRAFEGTDTDKARARWGESCVKHMAAVMRDRPPELVAKAVVAAGHDRAISQTKGFVRALRSTYGRWLPLW